MCGINGIVSLTAEADNYSVHIDRMNAALAHRGPDDAGVYSDGRATLGHRRLSVIDLSDAGHQPMTSADGRFVIVFNGEIYNFRDLRARLDYPFRSRSDTEVLLAAWQTWGPQCLDRLIGMFAFAVWDREAGKLHLVRDRLGKKPLYYFRDDLHIVFSSEVRGIAASGLYQPGLNPDAVVDYLRYQTVHQPYTLLKDIRLLPAAHRLSVRGGEERFHRYWFPLGQTGDRKAGLDGETAKRCIHDAFQRAVERRLVADVPFGAFLSGGIDSSAVVAMMSRLIGRVSTFSISFAEDEFSEARYARIVADKYRTYHHDIRLTAENFLDLLPEALDRMDHPSGDGPNTYVVAKVTREAGITMALSGLGGDELFAGYPVFADSLRLERASGLNIIPRPARVAAGRIVRGLIPGIGSAKVAAVLAQPHVSAMATYPLYRQVFLDDQIAELLGRADLPSNRLERMLTELNQEDAFRNAGLLSRLAVAEMASYMQHVLLRDTDQMSMAHALEVRIPFLDHELVELVLSLPDELRMARPPKRLLVESLGDLLPAEIVNRPKVGFTLPYAEWMKTSLREFCEAHLRRLAGRTLFNGTAVLRRWRDFLQGRPNVTWSRIWLLVVLEHWLERNGLGRT